MATVQRFEDLESWQCGRQLRQAVYGFTRQKPSASDFALVSQIRQAVQSITSNIAEGFERQGNREFIQFLSQAKGSVGEVKDQLYTALDECYVSPEEFALTYELVERTTRLIGGLMSYLHRNDKVGSKFVSQSRPAPKP